MRDVDIFDSISFFRIYRNSRVIYQFFKYGAKGVSKINPAIVFIDAAVALGELFISYSNYRQIREQNRQLEIEINTLKKELKNLKEILRLKEESFKYELEKNIQLIEKELRNNRQNYEFFLKLYEMARNSFLNLKDMVEYFRKEYPYSKETKKLEKMYYETLNKYVEATLKI